MIKQPLQVYELLVPSTTFKNGREGSEWKVEKTFTDYRKMKNYAKRMQIRCWTFSSFFEGNDENS